MPGVLVKRAPLVAALLLVNALSGARRAYAQATITPTFQGWLGSVSLSSGTMQEIFAAPQAAADLLTAGAQAIQSGYFSFLQNLSAGGAFSGQTMTVFPPAGQATLLVPAGAVPTGIILTLQIPALVAADSGGMAGLPGSAISIDCGGCQPAQAATLSLSYASASLGALDPSKFLIARFDTTVQGWVPLLSSVDTADQTVTAQLRHFSIFQIMQSRAAGDLAQARVIPNPFRPALGHAAMGFFNLPPNTRVRIYNHVGALLKDLTADGAGLAAWDGTNQWGAKVASGVYYALLQGAGRTRTISVAIQR